MLSSILSLGAIAGLASAVAAQDYKDVGNGVHVPGAIPHNSLEPLQHRLAFAGTDGMTISWNTFTKLNTSTVTYGYAPDKLEFTASSDTSKTYPSSRTWNQHVKLTGLKPGTKYYYKVSNHNIGGSAYLPIYSFKTAKAAGDDTPYTVAVIGDLGLMGEDGLSTKTGPRGGSTHAILDENETNTIQSMLELKDTYEYLLHVGDIGYADYFLKEATQGYFGLSDSETQPTIGAVNVKYEQLSEQFFDQMRPITAEKPWMVLPGNHEANCDNGGVTDKTHNITYTDAYCLPGQTNFTWYNTHFNMPSDESGGVESMWYSFDDGLVHYIMLNTETDLGADLLGPIENVTNNHNGPFGVPNQQIDWLKNDLENVDRSLTPWVIVSLHRPWYTNVGPPTWPVWQQAFEQIFYDYEVDMYFNGHVHSYERFSPMFNGTVDPNGLNNPRAPMPVLLGHAGHYDGLDEFTTTEGNRSVGTAYAQDQEFGWNRLTINNRTHITLEALYGRNSSVYDTATLYKAHDFSSSSSTSSSASSLAATKTGSTTASKRWCGKFRC
ncbi:hypothetical protein JCM8097_008966 [Rhodosporidiobolus ruineniae]